MEIISKLSSKTKKMDLLDYFLIKMSCVSFGVLLVVFFPGMIYYSPWLVLLLVLAFAIRPFYRFYIKKD